MSVQIVPYSQAHEMAWEQCCAGAVNSTLLHTRRFLSYHGNRFKDLSVLVVESRKIRAVFPAAQSPTDSALVVSHPGITFGGVVHQGWLSGMRMLEVFTALSEHYARNGYQRLLYKAVPHIYTRKPAQDDLYALFRLGAQRIRCDLSCAIDLANRQTSSGRRQRELKKTQKLVTLSSDPALLAQLWEVIAQNLARKHNARPVHSLTELVLLMGKFPEHISIRCALMAGRVEAGIIMFNTESAWHLQYVGASESAHEVSALDAVLDAAIVEAHLAGARYFDFGTSTEKDGKVLNDGLYRFKSGFGGGGITYEFYEIRFDNAF
ncbi:MAG: GNAT family N-acetyltransferase [Burkholderiaceae bacterium]|nr:GNAT family N-acetyltransferase [Burkholderiaceae bacterium]